MFSARHRKLRAPLHGVTLVTTAWLLLATSAPEEAARDCFEGLPPEATLRVTLGDSLLGQAAVGAAGAAGAVSFEPAGDGRFPSCRGLDGLEAGHELVLHVKQGERSLDANGRCYGYDLNSVEPLLNVAVTDESEWRGSHDVFAGAQGELDAGDTCRGSWSLVLGPLEEVERGTLISPLDAGGTEAWYLSRVIHFEAPAYCRLEPAEGQSPVHCEDAFRVERIEEVKP
jgi:hypothetical protein